MKIKNSILCFVWVRGVRVCTVRYWCVYVYVKMFESVTQYHACTYEQPSCDLFTTCVLFSSRGKKKVWVSLWEMDPGFWILIPLESFDQLCVRYSTYMREASSTSFFPLFLPSLLTSFLFFSFLFSLHGQFPPLHSTPLFFSSFLFSSILFFFSSLLLFSLFIPSFPTPILSPTFRIIIILFSLSKLHLSLSTWLDLKISLTLQGWHLKSISIVTILWNFPPLWFSPAIDQDHATPLCNVILCCTC